MKKLSQILAETKSDNEYYHASSSDKIDTKATHPIWLSHNEHQAKGWHKLVPESNSFRVKLHHDTKIAHYRDPRVQRILSRAGVDSEGYEADLTANPESHEVHEHPGTKALKKAGYHGFTHLDYDPHDNAKDHDTTVLFDRSKIKSHTKIKF